MPTPYQSTSYRSQVGGLTAAVIFAILLLGGAIWYLNSDVQQTAQINNASPNQVESSKGTGDPNQPQEMQPSKDSQKQVN